MKVGYNLATEPMIRLTFQGRKGVKGREGVDVSFIYCSTYVVK